MKKYTLSLAESLKHIPKFPDRTAKRSSGYGLNFDVEYQTWSSRQAMAKAIRKQQSHAPEYNDWNPLVKLNDGEGF